MKVKTYKMTIKSDAGTFVLCVSGSSKRAAIDKVLLFERCPESAILRIETAAGGYVRY